LSKQIVLEVIRAERARGVNEISSAAIARLAAERGVVVSRQYVYQVCKAEKFPTRGHKTRGYNECIFCKLPVLVRHPGRPYNKHRACWIAHGRKLPNKLVQVKCDGCGIMFEKYAYRTGLGKANFHSRQCCWSAGRDGKWSRYGTERFMPRVLRNLAL
jgi:hypothetical protein